MMPTLQAFPGSGRRSPKPLAPKPLRSRPMGLGLFTLAAASLALAAEGHARNAGHFGGGGGGPFTQGCRAGDALVGLDLRTGNALDQVTSRCARVAGKRVVGQVYTVGTAGGRGGKPQTVQCPANHIVSGLEIHKDHGGRIVQSVNLICTNLQTNKVVMANQRHTGGRAMGSSTVHCRGNEFGDGTYGRSGALVDQLGLRCAVRAGSEATAFEMNVTRPGSNYHEIRNPSGGALGCAAACDRDARCKAWSLNINSRNCHLKHSVPPAKASNNHVSGVKAVGSSGSSPPPPPPPSNLGQLVLKYAQGNLRKCVDKALRVQNAACRSPDGECTHLAQGALKHAKAWYPRQSGDFPASGAYVWGTRVQPPYQPGDVFQIWGGARLEGPGGAHWSTGDQHTAIIERVQGNVLHVIEQNSAGQRFVTRGTINLNWKLVRGSYAVFRPRT